MPRHSSDHCCWVAFALGTAAGSAADGASVEIDCTSCSSCARKAVFLHRRFRVACHTCCIVGLFAVSQSGIVNIFFARLPSQDSELSAASLINVARHVCDTGINKTVKTVKIPQISSARVRPKSFIFYLQKNTPTTPGPRKARSCVKNSISRFYVASHDVCMRQLLAPEH